MKIIVELYDEGKKLAPEGDSSVSDDNCLSDNYSIGAIKVLGIRATEQIGHSLCFLLGRLRFVGAFSCLGGKLRSRY